MGCVYIFLLFLFGPELSRYYLRRRPVRMRAAEVDTSVTALSHVLLCLQKQRSCVCVLNASCNGLQT